MDTAGVKGVSMEAAPVLMGGTTVPSPASSRAGGNGPVVLAASSLIFARSALRIAIFRAASSASFALSSSFFNRALEGALGMPRTPAASAAVESSKALSIFACSS